jgi:hypothetical protein
VNMTVLIRSAGTRSCKLMEAAQVSTALKADLLIDRTEARGDELTKLATGGVTSQPIKLK